MEKYTKDKLIDILLENNQRTVKYLANLDGVLKSLNDNNILHAQTLKSNTEVLKNNTETTSRVVKTLEKTMHLLSIVLILLLLAIIVVAGAEEALKFFPQIHLPL